MFKHVSHFFPDFKGPTSPSPSRPGKRGDDSPSDLFDFLSLIKNWPDLMGDMLAANTSPLRIRRGNLVILTRHAVFTHELSFMEECIKEKIHKKYPLLRKHFQKIQFLTSPGFFQNREAPTGNQVPLTDSSPTRPNTLHPFSPAYRQLKGEAEKLFQHIQFEDNELKNLFVSLYIQNSPKGE